MRNSIQKTNKDDKELPLSNDSQASFRKILKCGIYKELYRRSLLSDEQLNCLTDEK